jgi:hypothetical protein
MLQRMAAADRHKEFLQCLIFGELELRLAYGIDLPEINRWEEISYPVLTGRFVESSGIHSKIHQQCQAEFMLLSENSTA